MVIQILNGTDVRPSTMKPANLNSLKKQSENQGAGTPRRHEQHQQVKASSNSKTTRETDPKSGTQL
jgi:hypothetical protein